MKTLINPSITIEQLNSFSKNTLSENLGIEITRVGEDYIEARMPVDSRTVQPYGLLHGGASVALAETLGSIAAHCTVNDQSKHCVGLEINANHLKGVKNGFVTGIARPLHVGQRTHVWEIKITNEQNDLVCVSRITMAVIDKR